MNIFIPGRLKTIYTYILYVLYIYIYVYVYVYIYIFIYMYNGVLGFLSPVF